MRYGPFLNFGVALVLSLGPVAAAAGQDGGQPGPVVGKRFFRGELHYSVAKPIEGAIARELEEPTPDCGANALYLLLRLNGIACDRKALHGEVPVTGKGASMTDLTLAAARFGLSTDVVRILPEDLFKCGPSIALITNKESDKVGHYIVVLRRNETSLDYIDGTTGTRNTCDLGEFERAFSGYALIVPRGVTSRFVTTLFCVLIPLELAGLFVLAQLYWRARPVGHDRVPSV